LPKLNSQKRGGERVASDGQKPINLGMIAQCIAQGSRGDRRPPARGRSRDRNNTPGGDGVLIKKAEKKKKAREGVPRK